jgi:hypothetical protein
MARQKIDKAKRLAAGHLCFLLFHVTMTTAHKVQDLARPMRKAPGGQVLVGTRTFLGEGLNKRESEILLKRADHLLQIANDLRIMGHHLLKGIGTDVGRP